MIVVRFTVERSNSRTSSRIQIEREFKTFKQAVRFIYKEEHKQTSYISSYIHINNITVENYSNELDILFNHAKSIEDLKTMLK